MAADKPTETLIMEAPELLRSKVTGSGGPSMEMLKNADDEIKEVGSKYAEWTMKDIDRLSALLRQATETPATRSEQIIEIFGVSHDMRGQGTSFDYPLMTRIADSLCRFTEDLEQLDQKAMDLVRTHIEAMRAVIAHKVTGEDNELAQQIAAGLEIASTKWKTASEQAGS